MIRQIFVIVLFAFVISGISAQSFGIRAGLNYTSFSGPLEEGVNEKYSISDGFHFGVNYAYKFGDDFSLKGELLYTEVGSKYTMMENLFIRFRLVMHFFMKKANLPLK